MDHAELAPGQPSGRHGSGKSTLRRLDRLFLLVAAASGMVATLAAASATHGTDAGTPAAALLRTASGQGFWHGLGLIAVVLLRPRLSRRGGPIADAAGIAFAVGLILFCGSLYGVALGAPASVVYGAPVGGTAFILGWVALGLAVIL
jgi:uncharacterized membrane protein YgdD (TMEM256/DUF423 family)